MPEKLPTQLYGRHMGRELLACGYTFFKPEREYYIETPVNGVAQVSSWCGEEGPDEDGFGREECYDWWLLDERMQPIPGVEGLHSYSNIDMRVNRALWAARREKAEKVVARRKE